VGAALHSPPHATGQAGFVLANGSTSSNQSGEGEIRKAIVEGDLVDCMIALPGQLFYSTQIPACRWFLARDRRNGQFRDRRGHVLSIDARKLGTIDRVQREGSAWTRPPRLESHGAQDPVFEPLEQPPSRWEIPFRTRSA
jgi:type I restriction-modification system DNA methylase subunit